MIPLHLIETFVIFAENENLVKTAKVLGQTQPSASRQVDQFQTYFKKSLFRSVGRQKKLSPYGAEILNYYKKSILDVHNLRKNMPNINFNNQKEKLTLAARSEILQKFISQLKFTSLVELKALTGQQIRHEMNENLLDIAVLQENFDSLFYFRKKLFSSSWTLIIPKNFAPPHKASDWFDRAKQYPFATYDSDMLTVRESCYKSFDLPEVDLQFVAADWRLIAEQVYQQFCWAIVPEEYALKEKMNSLPMHEFMKPSSFFVYFKKELSRNKNIQNLITQLS